MRVLPLCKPEIEFEDVADDFREILKSGVLTRGPYVRSFETKVTRLVDVRWAFATSSCTTALHLTLVAAGIEPGDEVLVSDFSFPATGNAIIQAGARPVLVDSLADSFVLNLADAEEKITSRTRALMVVHPFGYPADMDRANALARRHNLLLVEDAACAIGARVGGKSCGSLSDAGCFSFHPRKIVTTGEGGMITTDRDDIANAVDVLRNHGGVKGEVATTFEANGFNYRMSEIQAALGLAQLSRLDEFLAGRQASVALYREQLAKESQIWFPAPLGNTSPSYQSLVIMLAAGIDRDRVVTLMASREVETTLGTYAMHAHPAFSRFGYSPGDLPNSWRYERQSLALPLYPNMGEESIVFVVAQLRQCLRLARR